MINVDKELKELLDSAFYSSTGWEWFIFILWDIFVPKKRDKLIDGLKSGMSWTYAYRNARNLK